MNSNYLTLKKKLLKWYELNKRELPWRNSRNPYKIWLSEIILQQTRVEQGTAYFHKFVRNYPTISHLAAASEDQVLKDWEGLGYYSRARNLHQSAKHIDDNLNATFPKNYNEIIKLKGVGAYTAAAISSFAFNEPKAVVDGNVYRFLSRLFGISTPIDTTEGKKEFQKLADDFLNYENPADHNQAIMEFGAMVCTPKNPDCESCPFKTECIAIQSDLISLLPIKSKKTKQRNRYFNYLVISDGEQLLLNRRGTDDIWTALYDFPMIESETSLKLEDLLNKIEWINLFNDKELKILSISEEYKHILSHQKIYAYFYLLKVDNINSFKKHNYLNIKLKEIDNFALPKLLVNYLNDTNDLLYLFNKKKQKQK